jgi:hypothetical protein
MIPEVTIDTDLAEDIRQGIEAPAAAVRRLSVVRRLPTEELFHQRRDVTSLRQTCATSMTRPHRHHVIICVVLLSGVAALPPLIKIGELL